MTTHMIISLIIFIVVFAVIAFELFNKTVIALLGAVLFIFLHYINQQNAFKEVDWNVIFLLIGMMIIVGITKRSGLFQYIAIKTAKVAKGNPIAILISLSLITAILSAFLDNVTTVLILTPVTILIAVELGFSPIIYIISEAIFSNIGGTATLIGDPPNVMIGSAAKISFLDFIIYLGPLVLILLVVISAIFYLLFRKKLVVNNERKARIMEFEESKSIQDKKLLVLSVTVLSFTIIGFLLHGFLGLEPATISIAGAFVLLLLINRHDIEEFFHDVEWGTILFFIGLFIMVGGLTESGVIKKFSEAILNLTKNDFKNTSFLVIWISGLFSGIVDNIPFVATMIPLVKNLGANVDRVVLLPVWFSLSVGACLGGNGTLIGASANVVSAGICGKSGYKISFLEFTKYGFFITVITLIISTAYIYFLFYF